MQNEEGFMLFEVQSWQSLGLTEERQEKH